MVDKLGPALRLLRKRAGLTQKDLGEVAGVGRTTIVKIETNVSALTVATLAKLLDALGASLVDLQEAMDLTSRLEGGPAAQGGGSIVIEGQRLTTEEFDRRLDAAFDRFVQRAQAAKAVTARNRGGDDD